MNFTILKPEQLDTQSPVKIDEWLDIDTDKCKGVDDNRPLTKKWLNMLLEDNTLQLDSLGRVWDRSEDTGKWYPYHLESQGKLYGIKVMKKAAN
jgi:hypothetical protein